MWWRPERERLVAGLVAGLLVAVLPPSVGLAQQEEATEATETADVATSEDGIEEEEEEEAEEPTRPVVKPNPSPDPELVEKVSAPSRPRPVVTAAVPMRDRVKESFQFGTYGRVSAGSDLFGGSGQQIRIVAHPPRLLETPYAELDFGYLHEVEATGTTFFTRATLAMAGDLFHATGDFDAIFGVRNLYLEAQDALTPGLDLWVGSRMYRGDDIYLLDFWPLDEQNTVGGGVGYRWSEQNGVKLHVGLNRLDDLFQTQFVTVTAEDFGTREVLFLDRQKVVGSLRAEQHLEVSGDLRLKAIAYGEAHGLPSGVQRNDDGSEQELPSDSGWLGGLELGLYGFGRNAYANLFARYGADLAAFDELAVPGDLAADRTATGAGELLFGLSGNIEPGPFGVLVGGYARYFEDADPVVFDPDDVWEIGAALRPAWFVTRHFHLIGEANVQYQRPNGLSPETQRQEVPVVWQLGLMPSLSLDRGSYSRPQLRLLYAVSFLNESARQRYAPEDVRRFRDVQHFLGISVEWWFNSSRG